MNKKSQMTSLIQIILIVIVLVAILFFMRSFISIGEKVVDDEICRTTAAANVKAKFVGLELFQLKCPRKVVHFYENGYKMYYSSRDIVDIEKKEFYKRFNYDDDDELLKNEYYELLADEMAGCWYKLGEGKYNFFKGLVEGRITKAQGCIICSDIINHVDNIDFNLLEFKQFLKKNKFTKYGKDVYYYDYLEYDLIQEKVKIANSEENDYMFFDPDVIDPDVIDLQDFPLFIDDSNTFNFLITYNVISINAFEYFFVSITNTDYNAYFCDTIK